MENLRFLLYEFICGKNWQSSLYESLAVEYYNKNFPEHIKYSKAYKVSNSQLYIWVKSSLIGNELSLKSTEIISSINKSLKSKIIDRLHFSVIDNWENSKDSITTSKKQKIKLSQSDENEINALLFNIENHEIKEVLKKIFSRALLLGKN